MVGSIIRDDSKQALGNAVAKLTWVPYDEPEELVRGKGVVRGDANDVRPSGRIVSFNWSSLPVVQAHRQTLGFIGITYPNK